MSLLTKGLALLKYADDWAKGDESLPSRGDPRYTRVSRVEKAEREFEALVRARKNLKRNWKK